MQKVLLIIFSLAFALPQYAHERSRQEMKRIAEKALCAMQTRGATQAEVQELVSGDAYAIYGTSQSFVVLSRDDSFQPVLGRSETAYLPGQMPCGFEWWLAAVSNAMQTHAGFGNTRSAVEPVEPLLTCRWGQGDPFNYLCPEISGRKAVTGCVSTAMAQILYYYKYPVASNGLGYYTMGDNSYRQLVELNNTYHWDLLKDSYANSFFLSEDEKQAIGQLMLDCGAASHMNYSTDGSGTTEFDAANGFSLVFGFDSLAMRCLERDYATEEEWVNAISQELKAKRPLLMCGMDQSTGGHAFVIDGINAEGFLHVNWGWDGTADGYYSFDDMNPAGILGQSSTRHYNFNQSILTGLRCDPVPAEDEVYRSHWVMEVPDTLSSNEMNGIRISGGEILWQHSHLTFYGKVGVVFLDQTGNEVLFHTFFDTSDHANGFTPTACSYGYYMNYFNRVGAAALSALPAGTYTAFIASKAIQESTAQPVGIPGGGHHEYTVTKGADGQLSVSLISTGIRAPRQASSDASSKLYDLQGRQLREAPAHGLYIQNGRKVVK